jgi:hypothetical protein
MHAVGRPHIGPGTHLARHVDGLMAHATPSVGFAQPMIDDAVVRIDLRTARALVTFEDAKLKLLAYVRDRIRNGELTERSFARQIGISQPHAHNALKGVRTLSPEVLDAILRYFHLSLLDLLSRPAPRA